MFLGLFSRVQHSDMPSMEMLVCLSARLYACLLIAWHSQVFSVPVFEAGSLASVMFLLHACAVLEPSQSFVCSAFASTLVPFDLLVCLVLYRFAVFCFSAMHSLLYTLRFSKLRFALLGITFPCPFFGLLLFSFVLLLGSPAFLSSPQFFPSVR